MLGFFQRAVAGRGVVSSFSSSLASFGQLKLAASPLFSTVSQSTLSNDPSPKSHLVDKFVGIGFSPLRTQLRAERLEKSRDLQRNEMDDGSPEVLVSMMTYRIRDAIKHFDKCKKDVEGMKTIDMLQHKRRRILQNLRRRNFSTYSMVLNKFGFPDVYSLPGIYGRYFDGITKSMPVTDDYARIRFNYHTKYKQRRRMHLWHRLRPELLKADPKFKV